MLCQDVAFADAKWIMRMLLFAIVVTVIFVESVLFDMAKAVIAVENCII
ncbi:MAG: hypothetical protein K2H24_01700 [Clostridia bacterium]|nr:hypothetical protein [Clostridia bacterium]